MTDLALAPSRDDHWPDAPGWMPLTIDRVDRIVGVADPRVRNLWITQSYADLARRLLPFLDGNQSWCTFAIWASNTAGVSIRGEELPTYVTRLIAGDSPHADAIVGATNRFGVHRLIGSRFEHHHLRDLVQEAIGQVSRHIAHGNTLVYAELAPLFVQFVEHLETHGAPSVSEIDELLDATGIPDAAAAPLVHVAFRHYGLAATGATDAAQHVLAANIAAVLHEQQRLQPDIAGALDAGLFDVADAISALGRSWLPGAARRLLARIAAVGVSKHVERLWADVATQLLMTLDVPGQTLHLGRDVPPIPDHRHLFPAELRELTLPHLCMLMETWDTTRGTGIGSGAADWADLHERMDYIVNLFRSRQQALDLTIPPFDAHEIAAMTDERLPARL